MISFAPGMERMAPERNGKLMMKKMLLLKMRSLVSFMMLGMFLWGCGNKGETDFVSTEIDTGWQFKNEKDTLWMPAAVPGTVHTDLLKAGMIDDPFYRDNEKNLHWIERETWVYRTRFDLDERLVDKRHLQLVFEGLDTYADVTLNGIPLLRADNMFRVWKADIGSIVRAGDNLLEITFLPAVVADSVKASKVGYRLPDTRAYSRKAPYQYGWDWGPRFVTCGIWRPVKVEGWNGTKIGSCQIAGQEISDTVARVDFVVDIEGDVSGADDRTKVELSVIKDGKEVVRRQVEVPAGQRKVNVPVTVNNPELWWCNGLGNPSLYRFEVVLLSGNRMLDRMKGDFGIREIELVREKDSIGESFYFKLNGRPVFMKGANFIPMDSFLPRVSQDDYDELLEMAVDANMNMLRVWGGGVYPGETFYNLCDRKGILVWQDFMFACNMYPGDSAFLENVKQEVRDNILHLRNHPSLALWCGNNEIDEAWHNWGWQKSLGYSARDSAEIWHSYLKVFNEIIPDAIRELDPGRPYHPSSPTIGWGHSESLRIGDMHYWGVWWGKKPFEASRKKVGRFMSEYGFQGMPPMSTVKKFTLPADRKIGSEVMQVHQKHPWGTQLIQQYMERDFVVPDDFEDYIYVSQLVQAYGIRTAIEAHRRSMPRCMGTLYWQLNDCWPVTSWSSVDYYGKWKALHYFAKEAYDEMLVSPVVEGEDVCVYIVSDKPDDLSAALKMKLVDFEGNRIWKRDTNILVRGNSSTMVFRMPVNDLLREGDSTRVVFVAGMSEDDGSVWSNLLYFSPPKSLDLPVANPDIHTAKTNSGYEIEVSTDRLIKNLCLDLPGIEGRFDNNFFDVLPGDTVKVLLKTDEIIDFDKNKFLLHQLNVFSDTQ